MLCRERVALLVALAFLAQNALSLSSDLNQILLSRFGRDATGNSSIKSLTWLTNATVGELGAVPFGAPWVTALQSDAVVTVLEHLLKVIPNEYEHLASSGRPPVDVAAQAFSRTVELGRLHAHTRHAVCNLLPGLYRALIISSVPSSPTQRHLPHQVYTHPTLHSPSLRY